MHKNSRCSTLEEAHELLPAVEKVLKRLEEKIKVSEKLHDHLLMEDLLHQAGSGMNPVSVQEDQKKLDESVELLAEHIQEMNALGCRICDLTKGWIDFPANHQGSSVFYVWKRGETQIRFYRSPHDKTKLISL